MNETTFCFYSVRNALIAIRGLTNIEFRYIPVSGRDELFAAKIVVHADFTNDVDDHLVLKTSISYSFRDEDGKVTSRFTRNRNE